MDEMVRVRPAKLADLGDINRVIEAAVMSWDLPERVKRLSLFSYRYTQVDFDHLEMVVAQSDTQGIIGVAAWEKADSKDAPPGKHALLLHGIYVIPSMHGQGMGQRLFLVAENAVQKHQLQGLLVKAQAGANGFFVAQGMQRLPDEGGTARYANRFWKSMTGGASEA
jgi:N-acetylglutamate synthase-like GNAT family acetyltransferase